MKESCLISAVKSISNWNSNFKMAAKVKPLATSQEVLVWICALTPEPTTSTAKKVLFKMCPIVLIFGNITGLASSVAFFVKFIKIDLEVSLFALFQIAGQVNMSNAIVVTICLRHRIEAMFRNLTNIYNECKRFNHYGL